MATRFRVFSTQAGPMGIVASGRGLRRVVLPERTAVAVRRAIGKDFGEATEDKTLLPELVDALRRYMEGERVAFDVRLDSGDASPFQAKVWRACWRIGYGRTITYGELAALAGHANAARAVGSAMRCNPFPIVVPCHRVLRGDGSLGGYSGPGGLAFKRWLLELEGAGQPAV